MDLVVVRMPSAWPVAVAVVLALSACAPAADPNPSPTTASIIAAPEWHTGASPSRFETILWMPVSGVHVHGLTSNFGAPRGDRIHEGIDIFAAEGTAVHSAGPGRISFVGQTRAGGWTVWIEDRQYDMWYTHLFAVSPDLRKGQHVTTETLLGWVGSTGNAVGGPPHLHFEVHADGVPFDPLPLLADR